MLFTSNNETYTGGPTFNTAKTEAERLDFEIEQHMKLIED